MKKKVNTSLKTNPWNDNRRYRASSYFPERVVTSHQAFSALYNSADYLSNFREFLTEDIWKTKFVINVINSAGKTEKTVLWVKTYKRNTMSLYTAQELNYTRVVVILRGGIVHWRCFGQRLHHHIITRH